MAEITTGMVKELRELTGLGMMECKKALEEAGGDMKKAEELLRIKSGAKASKAASRVAADGAIGTFREGSVGALVEVNAETDFVAKNPDFIEFTTKVAELVAKQKPADVAALEVAKSLAAERPTDSVLAALEHSQRCESRAVSTRETRMSRFW